MTLYKSIPHESIPLFIIETTDHLKTQETHNEAVRIVAYSLMYVPDHLKTQAMCNEAVHSKAFSLEFVLNYFKTKEMCKGAVDRGPQSLAYALIGIRRRSCEVRQWT